MAKNSSPGLTRGAVALAEAIAREKLGVNEAAKLINAPAGMFSRLLRGERLPSIWWGDKIEERFGVPCRLWARPAQPAAEAAA